jgi:hypothetical protein
MSTERFNIIYKDYPERYEVAKKRNTLIWERKYESKLTKTLIARIAAGEVIWRAFIHNRKAKEALFDVKESCYIIKNPKAAGTPRTVAISARFLWSGGKGTEFVRKEIKEFLHEWFRPGIKRQAPEKIFTRPGYFIQFEYIFYYAFANKKNWKLYQDYLNHAFIHSKAFEDTLVEMGVIPDDGPQYVRGGYARYVDIMELDGNQDRRLEIKIHFCKNNERIS